MIIELIDRQKVIARLSNFKLAELLKRPFQKIMLKMQADIAKYPPPRTGSSYVRTGTLGRRWTTAPIVISGLNAKVVNNTKYGPYVQSAKNQAWMHAGRWQTDEDVMKANEKTALDLVDKAIEEYLNVGS